MLQQRVLIPIAHLQRTRMTQMTSFLSILEYLAATARAVRSAVNAQWVALPEW